ncbi:MAG: restriction endonuclease subunit S [Nitrosomonas sp.]|nr:restriction endonuclease subunit S [Nitrosomonas sp.]
MLRNALAAAKPASGGSGTSRQGAPGKDGVCMALKPGYKQTEVGMIPEDWNVEVLADKSKIVDSLHRTPKFSLDGYPMVRVTDIKPGNLNLKGTLKVNEAVYSEFTRNYKPKRGDIVLSRVGSYGVSSYVETDEPFCLGQNTVVVESKIPARYLYFVLNSKNIREQIENESYGSGYKSLSLKNIKELFIPFPQTKAEQTAIANALSDADALIQSLASLIAKKRQIKQGTMQTLLNPHENGRLKEGWVVKKLGNILRVCHGKSQHEVTDRNGKYPILATSGEIGRASKYLYDKPSVLIGRKGTIDVPQYMGHPFWSIDTLFYTEIFEPNNAKYLFYQFNLIDWYAHNEASGVPSLSARTIENIDISIPSPEKQVQIALILSEMDTEIAALEAKLAKYRHIKQGMMQNLLTGRIRLI